MPKININNILRGMTVTSFGMGAFNLFNNIQNRNWQTRVDALIADRESLSAKISVLQEVKIESLEHKITVEEQINKVLIALNENNKSLTSLKDYALANPSTLNPEIVNAKIEQAEKSGKMVNETANNLFNNLKSSIGDEWFNSILKSIQEWFNTLGFSELIAAVNLFGCLTITLSLISILIILYSENLINKFNLINRYPKLQEIIKLRVTFKRYYMILDFTLIFIVLFTMIVLNLLVIFY